MGTAFANADDTLQKMIDQHLKHYSKPEHFSAIQVSIKAGDKRSQYNSGTISLDPKSPKLTGKHLFDTGSITKSFTAALAVIAEREHQLSLDKTLGEYLEEYPNWAKITLKGLLDMSTGIPNYSESSTLNYFMSIELDRYWTAKDLINLVYPKEYNPPLKPGYFYSNTGYVLMDMMLTKQYKMPFKQLLTDKLINPLALKNTFYPVPEPSKEMLSRMAHGYSFNIYDNPEILGRDVTNNNLSWAGAAGAIVANSEDVLSWVEALFSHNKVLSNAEKARMHQLISLKTGQPIQQVDEENPRGFGLGLVQGYDPKRGGLYWFYEGETLGYRALYLYVPCNKVSVVALFNSATNTENDHSSELLLGVYDQVLKRNTHLNCVAEPNFA